MDNIFKKRYYLYKTVVLDELLGLHTSEFKRFDTSLCLDFRIFTDKKEIVKYSNEFKLNNNLDKIFFACFEIDEKHYVNLKEKQNNEGAILISKEELEELNLHILDRGIVNSILLEQIFEYRNMLIDIPVWVVLFLKDKGVTFDNEYFEYIYSFNRPFKCGGVNLFVADFYNKKYRDKLGRIIVYKQDPTLYDDVWSAVFDNYDQKYRFGFEKLHDIGIVPVSKVSRSVSKFGVCIKELSRQVENPYIVNLNNTIDDLYQWKYGKRALRCYNDSYFRDQNDGQSLEEFKAKEVRYRCFTSLFSMNFALNASGVKEEPVERDRALYTDSISTILNRYTYNGKTVFQKVDDLNDFQDLPGIYILCFDYERKLYIGQTKKCLKERVLQHFTKPQSQFDKNHSLEEVSNIYALNVSNEWLDYVEMDCIASVTSKILFNVFAGGSSIEKINSKHYDQKRYLLGGGQISFVSEQAYALNGIMEKRE